eukprot:4172899-Amphidinium_carterae.1
MAALCDPTAGAENYLQQMQLRLCLQISEESTAVFRDNPLQHYKGNHAKLAIGSSKVCWCGFWSVLR